MPSVISFITSPTWFMLSTRFLLEFSTSFMAESITCILLPICAESSVILVTLSLTWVIFSRFRRISSMVLIIDSVILPEVSSKWLSAPMILSEEVFVPILKLRISSATTPILKRLMVRLFSTSVSGKTRAALNHCRTMTFSGAEGAKRNLLPNMSIFSLRIVQGNFW